MTNFETHNLPKGIGRKSYFGTKFGIIDFDVLTDKDASRLIHRGFPYLKEKPKPEAKKKKSDSEIL